MLVEPGDHRLDVYWDASPEDAVDPTSPAPEGKDFEGYRVYVGLDRGSPTRIAQFDRVDTTGFNTGLDSLTTAAPRILNGVSYPYHYAVTGLRDGFNSTARSPVSTSATPASRASRAGSARTSSRRCRRHARTSAPGGPTVYPNPYRVEARWDQGQLVRDHYLWFAQLPRRCVLRIYTLAGAKVFETRFDGATYRGESARGLYDPRQDRDVGAPYLSGASFAWDLISDQGQAIASGLYLFAVEDLDSGQRLAREVPGGEVGPGRLARARRREARIILTAGGALLRFSHPS
mgnify:CR=1 FL=1